MEWVAGQDSGVCVLAKRSGVVTSVNGKQIIVRADKDVYKRQVKDMAGLLKPEAAYALVAALKDAVDLPIHLHSHEGGGLTL